MPAKGASRRGRVHADRERGKRLRPKGGLDDLIPTDPVAAIAPRRVLPMLISSRDQIGANA